MTATACSRQRSAAVSNCFSTRHEARLLFLRRVCLLLMRLKGGRARGGSKFTRVEISIAASVNYKAAKVSKIFWGQCTDKLLENCGRSSEEEEREKINGK